LFGIFCGRLVYSPVLVCCTMKNLATQVDALQIQIADYQFSTCCWAQTVTTPCEIEATIGRTGCHCNGWRNASTG
jgi:hypothetical protein